MKKVVTMGEMLLRLTPRHYKRLVQADMFRAIFGGGEANVAISLSNLGHESLFVSMIPDNEIGKACKNVLDENGVNTDYLKFGGDRLGVYYSEEGVGMRPSYVIYDRLNSSITKASVADFDFDEIFEDAAIFHISGITPALSESCRILTKHAMKKAKEHKVFVSFDLNYRSSLWKLEDAVKFYEEVSPYVDLCIGVIPQIHKSFKGVFNEKSLEKMFKETHQRTGIPYITSTIRKSFSATDNRLSAGIYNGRDAHFTDEIDVRVEERIGGGDSYSAGLLSSLLDGKDKNEAVEFAIRASALKHTIKGDYNLTERDEVEEFLRGNDSGRIDW